MTLLILAPMRWNLLLWWESDWTHWGCKRSFQIGTSDGDTLCETSVCSNIHWWQSPQKTSQIDRSSYCGWWHRSLSTNTDQFTCIFGQLFQLLMIPFNARCGGCCCFSSVGNSRQNDKIKSVGKYFMLWTKPLLDMISFEIPAHSSTFHISSLVNLGEQFIMCMSWTGNNQRATDGHTYSVLCSLHVFVSLGPFRFNHDVWLENCPNCVMWWTLCNHCVMCELFRSVSEVLQHSINFCVLSFVNSNHSLIQEFKSLSQLHSSFKRYICLRECSHFR